MQDGNLTEISPKLLELNYSCGCGCGLRSFSINTLRVMHDALEYFEEVYMRGLTPFVNSACRCRDHNEVVQKEADEDYVPFSSKSRHMPDEEGVCDAVDWGIKEVPPYQLYNYLHDMYPSCLGIIKYSWGVHLDTRAIPYHSDKG